MSAKISWFVVAVASLSGWLDADTVSVKLVVMLSKESRTVTVIVLSPRLCNVCGHAAEHQCVAIC